VALVGDGLRLAHLAAGDEQRGGSGGAHEGGLPGVGVLAGDALVPGHRVGNGPRLESGEQGVDPAL
jgi:hypothetical protein